MIKDFATHARLIREGWQRFTECALTSETVTIFECALLQNPFTTSILYQNLPNAETLAFVSGPFGCRAAIAPAYPLPGSARRAGCPVGALQSNAPSSGSMRSVVT